MSAHKSRNAGNDVDLPAVQEEGSDRGAEDSDDEHDEEDGPSDEDDHHSVLPEQTLSADQHAEEQALALSIDADRSPYDAFLAYVATICPTIPHLTYGILIVVISTLPSNLLPVVDLSSQLEELFAQFWFPADSRLLSTHAPMGQNSAFVEFVLAVIDCTSYLTTKSLSALPEEQKIGSKDVTGRLLEAAIPGDGSAATWLVQQQLARRVWGDGNSESPPARSDYRC